MAGISAQYLGWLPTGGSHGDQFVDPILQDLLDRGLRWSAHRLRRHWLQLQGDNLCIREFSAQDSAYGRRSRTDAILYDDAECCSYTIPSTDIGYIKIDSLDRLAFGIILIGYNEESTYSAHVHAWRGNSAGDVANLMAQLAALIEADLQLEQFMRLQQPVLEQISASSAATAGAKGNTAGLGSSMANSLALELRQRLDTGGATPLLHPPKDYDTLSRSHGNLRIRQSVQQLGESTQAPNGAYIRRPFVMTAAEEQKQLLQQRLQAQAVADAPDGQKSPKSPPGFLDQPAAYSRASGDRQKSHGAVSPSHYHHYQLANSSNMNYENHAEFEVPPPDYDTVAISSISSASRGRGAYVGEDLRWSDPRLGFSTWRRLKGNQLNQTRGYQESQQY